MEEIALFLWAANAGSWNQIELILVWDISVKSLKNHVVRNNKVELQCTILGRRTDRVIAFSIVRFTGRGDVIRIGYHALVRV